MNLGASGHQGKAGLLSFYLGYVRIIAALNVRNDVPKNNLGDKNKNQMKSSRSKEAPIAPRRYARYTYATPIDRRNAQIISRRLARRIQKRKTPKSRIFISLLVLFPFLAMVIGYAGINFALTFVYGSVKSLPTTHPLAADSFVYDRNGAVIADLHPPGDIRIPVPLSDISPYVIKATVDTEDKNFWQEGPVDTQRLIASALQDISKGNFQQGGSTITAQLAKILYLTDTKTIDRKVKQLAIANLLSKTYSKNQILEFYLNDIYYGHGATGIQAAAQVYFGVDAKALTLAQATLLVGLPNAPAEFDPYYNLSAAKQRQGTILHAMVQNFDLTLNEENRALDTELKLAHTSLNPYIKYSAFTSHVVSVIQSQYHLNPYTDGLKIITTLDSKAQDLAQQTVNQQVAAVNKLHVTDGALVSINPQNGQVLAYVGNAGDNVPGADFDMAAIPRQPGSTFKLFTYSAALNAHKITMLTNVVDGPYTLPKGAGADGKLPYQINNYDLTYHGIMPIKKAFPNSLNVPAVKVEQLVGVPEVIKMARTLGVTTLTAADSTYGASATLGTYPLPLWELAQAGSVFANAGIMNPAVFITSLKDSNGNELFSPTKPRQVLDPGVAFIINQILGDDSNRVLEFGAHGALTLDNHIVSAKTGTTQDFKDNLTVGWTPHLVTAVWVGNTDNTPMVGTTGITGAAPIWHNYMAQQLFKVPDNWPNAPVDVLKSFMNGQQGWFLAGTQTLPQPQALLGSGSYIGGNSGPHPPSGCRTVYHYGSNGYVSWTYVCGGG